MTIWKTSRRSRSCIVAEAKATPLVSAAAAPAVSATSRAARRENPISWLSLISIVLVLSSQRAVAAIDTFDCVRDLFAVTDQASMQGQRKSVEKPFMDGTRFMIFPEVISGNLTGFYVYSHGKASYFDSYKSSRPGLTVPQKIAGLRSKSNRVVYDMVAQPTDLETLTLHYLPGFGEVDAHMALPGILGASVLPVVGAFISWSDDRVRTVYHNPNDVEESELKRWIADHSRKPATTTPSGPGVAAAATSHTGTGSTASTGNIEIRHEVLALLTQSPKSGDALWGPLMRELDLRREWVKTHNLDEVTFKKFSHIMQTTCR